MNSLIDEEIVGALYAASRAGVRIQLNVRGICALVPGVPDVSANIEVVSIVDRFLEHSRVYFFLNGGDEQVYLSSADWMRRNLDNRVETIMPVSDEKVKQELAAILDVYDNDNSSAWDCLPDGSYVLRRPPKGKTHNSAQEMFIKLAQTE